MTLKSSVTHSDETRCLKINDMKVSVAVPFKMIDILKAWAGDKSCTTCFSAS